MTGQVAHAVVFEGPSPPSHRTAAEAVWRWSDGRTFTQAVQTKTLDPGESFTVELSWEDPSSGTYTVEASLEAADATLVKQRSFTVPGDCDGPSGS